MKKFQFLAPFFFSLVAIIMAPNLLFSQGQMSVIITDPDQRPLPGVAVEICSSVLERVLIGVTDVSGACHFRDLPQGSYQIKCGSVGSRIKILKNISVCSAPITIEVSMEEQFIIGEHIDFIDPPVDPKITSLTSKDANLLSEASSSLHQHIESTRDRMDVANDICERREILKEALKNWRDILEKTKNKLKSLPQAHEKRFMINTIFDGILKHMRTDLNSIREFDQNASILRTDLSAIENFLRHVSDTGKATFDLHISSFPEDAEVAYRYSYGGYVKKHHERTPTTIKDLYFAPCIIIFKQEGRTSVASITYDPFRFLEAGIHQVRMHLLDKSQWGASYQNPPLLEERVNKSDLIIAGKVQKSECRRNEKSSDVYTYVTVLVEECIKGADILKGDEIVIKKLGGSIKEEGIVHHVERHPAGFSQPGFSKNERVLLLLRLLPDSMYYEVVAGQHGKFSIMKDDIIAGKYVSLKEFIRKIKE